MDVNLLWPRVVVMVLWVSPGNGLGYTQDSDWYFIRSVDGIINGYPSKKERFVFDTFCLGGPLYDFVFFGGKGEATHSMWKPL